MTKLEIYRFVSLLIRLLFLLIVKLIRAFVKTPCNCVYYLLYVVLFSSFFLTVIYIYDVKYRVLTIYSNYIVICVISINC